MNVEQEIERCFQREREFYREEREAVESGRYGLAESAHAWRLYWVSEAQKLIGDRSALAAEATP